MGDFDLKLDPFWVLIKPCLRKSSYYYYYNKVPLKKLPLLSDEKQMRKGREATSSAKVIF